MSPQHVTPRAPYGSMLKPSGKERLAKKRQRKTPKQKRMDDPENDKKHLEAICSLPCCVKGCQTRLVIQPHHLKRGVPRGGAQRSTDRYAVPLCHEHHIHGVEICGTDGMTEDDWFADIALIDDQISLADGLWAVSPNVEAMQNVLLAHWSEE